MATLNSNRRIIWCHSLMSLNPFNTWLLAPFVDHLAHVHYYPVMSADHRRLKMHDAMKWRVQSHSEQSTLTRDTSTQKLTFTLRRCASLSLASRRESRGLRERNRSVNGYNIPKMKPTELKNLTGQLKETLKTTQSGKHSDLRVGFNFNGPIYNLFFKVYQ